MTGSRSRWIAIVALAALGALLLVDGISTARLVAVAPLAALAVAALARMSRWSIAAAIVMLPYFSWGVMDILTAPSGRPRAIVFAALSVVVFFAALDSLRRDSGRSVGGPEHRAHERHGE